MVAQLAIPYPTGTSIIPAAKWESQHCVFPFTRMHNLRRKQIDSKDGTSYKNEKKEFGIRHQIEDVCRLDRRVSHFLSGTQFLRLRAEAQSVSGEIQ